MGRKASHQDSLDLLLDTICNTFGGVLFIAILVVIMLSMTSNEIALSPASQVSQAELAAAQVKLARTQSELASLQAALEEQAEISRLIDQPGLRDRLRDVTQAQQTVASQMARQKENLESAAKSQQEVNQIADAVKALENARREAQQRLAQADAALNAEISRRERRLTLPKQRDTDKAEIPCFLKNGRVTTYMIPGLGGALGFNAAECEHGSDAEINYVLPKPRVGILINPAEGAPVNLAQRLDLFDPRQHYIAIFVWPDSFEHFQTVRKAFVEKGFEYWLVPLPADAKVPTGQAVMKRKVQGG